MSERSAMAGEISPPLNAKRFMMFNEVWIG